MGGRQESRQQEQRTRRWGLYDDLPLAVAVSDADGRVSYLNHMARRLLGGPDPARLLREGFALPGPDGASLPFTAWLQRVANREDDVPRRVTLALQRPEGSVPLQVDAAPQRDGCVVSALSELSDCSESETKLRGSERLYRTIVETASEGVWIIDREGRTTFVNEAMGRMLGYSRQQMLGRHLFDFMDAEAQREAAARMQRRQQGIAEQHDFRFRHREGRAVWALLETSPLYDDRGGYEGALAMVTDISERRRAAEEQALAAAILEQLPEAVIVTDELGMIQRSSGSVEAVLGYSQDALTGRHVAAFMPRRLRPTLLAALEEGFGAGSFSRELVLLRADGSEIPVETSQRELTLEDGRRLRVGIVRDARPRKQWEAELALALASERAAREEAETLAEIGRRISESLERDHILQIVTASARRVVAADSSHLTLCDDAGTLRAVACAGERTPRLAQLCVPVGHGLGSVVVATGAPAQSADYQRDAGIQRDPASQAIAEAEGIVSSLGVPIVSGGRVLGVLFLNTRHERRFTAEQIRLLERIAGQAAVAIENARALDEARSRERELETLRRAAARLNDLSEPELVLRIAVELAVDAIPVSFVGIALNEGDHLRHYGTLIDGAWLPGTHTLPLDGSIAGWVVRHAAPYRSHDVRADPHAYFPSAGAPILGQMPRALGPSLDVPVIGRDRRVLAVLGFRGGEGEPAFSDSDQRLAEGIASYAAAALERAAAATEARRRAAELESIVNQLSDGVWVLDREARILLVNHVAQSWHEEAGLGPALGRPMLDFVALLQLPEGGPLSNGPAAFRRALAGETDVNVLGRLRLPQRGVDRYLRASIGPLRDERGDVVGALIAARDVTRLQQSEQEAQRLERLRAAGQLAAGVAHDLNNILGVALGRTDVLLELGRRQASLQPPVLDSLATVRAALLDAAETVRRLQTFARPRDPRAFAPVLLDRIARDSIDLARPRWRDEAQRQGRLIRVQEQLDATPPIEGSAAELREAVLNLLINAVDALPDGGTITVATAADGEEVCLSIADDGAGMPAEVEARAWEPFFTTKQERGTGLGLAMVHGIVDRHGGRVSLRTAPGEGTRVSLSFPRSSGAQQLEEQPPAAASRRRRRVLVVDDEAGMRETVAAMLRLEGQEPLTVTSGAEALALLDAEPVDLVISDHGMPGMTGLELAQRLRARNNRLPLVLLTGWGQSLDEREVKQQTHARLVAKPLTLARLREVLASVAE